MAPIYKFDVFIESILLFQINLRKKQYIFDKSDAKVNHFFKLRDGEVKNGNSNWNQDPEDPPNKKVKLDESSGKRVMI